MKNKRIAFICNNVKGVNFWRMKQFYETLKNRGYLAAMYGYEDNDRGLVRWEFDFPYNRNIRNDVYKILMASDVAIMGYIHVPILVGMVMMLREKFNKKILAEIDDEIIDTPDYNPAFKQGCTPGNNVEKTVIEHLKCSDGVITSTDFLTKYYKRFNNKIYTIPNSIDFNKWNVVNKDRNSNRIRIGWIGGGNHDQDLLIMKDVIPIILNKYKNIEFYFVHGVPQYIKDMCGAFNLGRVKFTPKWGKIEKYPQHVASFGFDIGLAPLVQNKFNQSKSNLRWLEYSALGIPCVATNIEPYKKSIVQGKTGCLADSVDDWVKHLSMLIDNKNLRKAVGSNAYMSVKKDYNLEKTTDKYINILGGIVNE